MLLYDISNRFIEMYLNDIWWKHYKKFTELQFNFY